MPASLAHVVGAGVHDLGSGGAAVTDVVGVGVGDPVDLEVEEAGVGIDRARHQVLDHGQAAGFPGVGDGADDGLAVADGDVGQAGAVAGGDHDVGVVDALDGRVVVGQVGAGAGHLAHVVGAGVHDLGSGGAAVTDVVGVGVGDPVDLEVEEAGVGIDRARHQVLDHGQAAGFPGVGDGADDGLAVADGDVGQAGAVAGGDHDVGVVDALDGRVVVGQVGAGAGHLAHVVGAGVHDLGSGGAAVTDVVGVGVGDPVDLEVEEAGVGIDRARHQVLDHGQAAGFPGVGVDAGDLLAEVDVDVDGAVGLVLCPFAGSRAQDGGGVVVEVLGAAAAVSSMV